jgi:O-antigen/teichoic acid export membrane protein
MTTDLLRSRIHSGIKWSAAAAYIRWGMRFFVLAILATLIDKREFGLLEIATVIILITQNFSELGIGQAIIWHRGHLADDPDSTDAIAATLNSGFWIVVTLNMTLLVLAFFAAPLVAAYAQEPRATLVIQVLLISTIFGTLTIVPRTQLERDLAFRAAALPEVLPSVASGIVSIILAVMYRNVWALVAGQVVHAAMRFLLYAWAARWIPRMQFDGAVCKELLKFSMPLLGAGLINMMIAIMPTAIIVRMLGLEAVGVYGLAHRVAVLPLFGIIYVIGRVMFPVYTRFQNDLHGMRRGVVEALRLTTVIAAPVCLGIATIIPAAELVVYHGRWWDMPFPLAVLILLTLQRVVGSIAGDVCKATGRPGLTQLFFGVRLVVLVPACLLGGLGWGLNGAVIGVLLANTASLVLEVRKMHERIDLSPWEIFDAVKLPLAAAGLACTAAALVLNSMLLGPTIAGLVVGVGAAAIIYIWLMFTFERPMIWALRAAMFSREKPSGSVAAVAAHEPLRPTPAASDPSAIMGRWFVRHITYPLLGPILKGIDGKGVLEAYGKYGESERWPIERHREEQWRRIQALIRHAHGNCPLHRERFQAIGAEPGDFKSLEDYAKLPPLRREELQTHLARLIAENADPNDYELHSTSGSTGTPLSIAVDKSRLIPIRAMVHRNQDWIGLHFGDRVALLWAGFAERHSARQLSNRIGLWALNQMWESAWDLSDDS